MSSAGWMAGRPAARRLAVLLGVPAAADEAELKRAFRGRVKELHPDAGGTGTTDSVGIDDLLAAHARYTEESASDSRGEPDDPWGEPWTSSPTTAESSDRTSRAADLPAPTVPGSDGPAAPGPWWVPGEPGPEPRPGFWSRRP